jgi:flagellar motor switch protein FliN/FliY
MENAAVAPQCNVEPLRRIPELGSLGDIPLDIEIVLAQCVMRLKEVADWQPGSLLTLTRPAGEPLDVFVSGELFGHGEIEVSHDNFGLRITGFAT